MTTATAPTRKKQNRPKAPVPPPAEQVQEQPRSEAERIRAEIAAAQQARQDIETKLAEMRNRLAGAVEAEREAARVAWTRDAQDAIRQAAFDVPGRLLMLFVLDRLAIIWELDDDSLKDFRDEIDASARPTLKALLAMERRIKDDDVTIAGLQNPSPELMRELARVWKVPLPAESNGYEIAPGYLDKPLANGLNRVREGDLEFVRFADGEVAVFIAGVKIEPPADEVLAQARTALMLDEPVTETPTAPTPERSTRKRHTATPPPEVATTDADYLREAEELVRAEGHCAISLLQRRLSIGYTRASNLRDQLKAAGIINDGGDLVAAHRPDTDKPSESADTAPETRGPARTDETVVLPPIAGILNGSLYTPEQLGTTPKGIDKAHHPALGSSARGGRRYCVNEFTLSLEVGPEWPWIAVTPDPFSDHGAEDGELWLLPLLPKDYTMVEDGGMFSGIVVGRHAAEVKIGNLEMGYRVKPGGT